MKTMEKDASIIRLHPLKVHRTEALPPELDGACTELRKCYLAGLVALTGVGILSADQQGCYIAENITPGMYNGTQLEGYMKVRVWKGLAWTSQATLEEAAHPPDEVYNINSISRHPDVFDESVIAVLGAVAQGVDAIRQEYPDFTIKWEEIQAGCDPYCEAARVIDLRDYVDSPHGDP